MRIHPKNILWPTDLSENALKGAPYARSFAEVFHVRLHVMHICPILELKDGWLPATTGGDMLVSSEMMIPPAEKSLGRVLAQQFGNINIRDIRTEVILGDSWHEICRYVKKHKIDLVIMATHGLTGLKHVLMGSTAERVVQHANCPVLTVKSFEREFVDRPRLQRSVSRAKLTLSAKTLQRQTMVSR